MTQLQPIAAALDTETRLQNFLAGRPRTKPNGEAQYQERDPAKLQVQINGLSDILALNVRQKDALEDRQRHAQNRLVALSLKFWVLSGVVLGEGAVIGWLATELFSRLH